MENKELEGCRFFRLENSCPTELCICVNDSWENSFIVVSVHENDPFVFKLKKSSVENKDLFSALNTASIFTMEQNKCKIIFTEEPKETVGPAIKNAVNELIKNQSE